MGLSGCDFLPESAHLAKRKSRSQGHRRVSTGPRVTDQGLWLVPLGSGVHLCPEKAGTGKTDVRKDLTTRCMSQSHSGCRWGAGLQPGDLSSSWAWDSGTVAPPGAAGVRSWEQVETYRCDG